MAYFTVRPTRADVALADAIAANTGPRTEAAAETLTWGADEHILCALAAGWWLACRNGTANDRRSSDHILLTTLVASALPHLLKTVFDQERPDRTTIRGHWRGVPLSGKRLDAFPSGHAVHVGALASAASTLPTKQRNVVWGIGAGLVLTRIVLLAHWASDVAVGLAIGALTERLLRSVTGYGRENRALPPGSRTNQHSSKPFRDHNSTTRGNGLAR
jgi:undecaprenyl-diphosphatase